MKPATISKRSNTAYKSKLTAKDIQEIKRLALRINRHGKKLEENFYGKVVDIAGFVREDAAAIKSILKK